jgi:hypothetical protein
MSEANLARHVDKTAVSIFHKPGGRTTACCTGGVRTYEGSSGGG